jgi:hypothetical protein
MSAVALCATLYADEALSQTPGAPPNLAKVTKETEGTCRVSSLVVKKIENNQWEDPDFLKPFEGNGEAVELRDEDSKTVYLKVIEKKSVGKE